jgi:hypothetical protein
MKTLKSIAVIAGLAFITINLSAQGGGGNMGNMDPQQRAQKETANIKEHVTGITPDQESKISAVEQDFAKSAKDVWSSSNGDHDAMKSKMQPLKESRDAKIKGILSADQYAQYTKMQEAHQMGGRKGGMQ